MRTLILLFALSLMAYTTMAAVPESKFIYHTVEKGETLYSISHHYGMKPEELAQYNENISEKLTVKIGQKLKIPTIHIEGDGGSVELEKPHLAALKQDTKVDEDNIHIVKKGETVFSISKMYNISRDDLQAWNNIKDLSIKVGQKLVVNNESVTMRLTGTPVEILKPHAKTHTHAETEIAPATTTATAAPAISRSDIQRAMKKDGYVWTLPTTESSKKAVGATKEVNVSTATADATASINAVGMADAKANNAWNPEANTSWRVESTAERMDANHAKPYYDPANEYESLYYQNIYSGMNKRTEAGTAKFLSDNNTANIAYYNNASIGSILKLTNPENGRTTYAIVVGKIPPTESSYLLKLSNKVSKNLNAKDYSNVEVVCYTPN